MPAALRASAGQVVGSTRGAWDCGSSRTRPRGRGLPGRPGIPGAVPRGTRGIATGTVWVGDSVTWDLVMRPRGKGTRGPPRGKRRASVRAEKAQRVETALDLRVAGLTVDQIAERLGVSYSTAQQDISAALAKAAESTKEKTAELRELGVARCERIVAELMPQASNPKAAEVILKAEGRRAKLLGLDAPQRIEHSEAVDFGATRDALSQAIAKLPPAPDSSGAGGAAEQSESEGPTSGTVRLGNLGSG